MDAVPSSPHLATSPLPLETTPSAPRADNSADNSAGPHGASLVRPPSAPPDDGTSCVTASDGTKTNNLGSMAAPPLNNDSNAGARGHSLPPVRSPPVRMPEPSLLSLHGSVLPHTIIPCFVLGAWAALVWALHEHAKFSLMIEGKDFISVTSLVLALLLGFRTNTAYECFWDGRKQWATLFSSTRTLFRLIRAHSVTASPRPPVEQDRHAFGLCVAFGVALRNQARGVLGFFKRDGTLRPDFVDLVPLSSKHAELDSIFDADYPYIAQAVLALISREFDYRVQNQALDPGCYTASLNAVASLSDVLTAVERIILTPIPVAYAVHLKQVVYLYLFMLPPQLLKPLGYLSIPATVLATFVVVGVEMIGREIENPFGSDYNDLPLDSFVAQLRAEAESVAASTSVSAINNADIFDLVSNSYQGGLHSSHTVGGPS